MIFMYYKLIFNHWRVWCLVHNWLSSGQLVKLCDVMGLVLRLSYAHERFWFTQSVWNLLLLFSTYCCSCNSKYFSNLKYWRARYCFYNKVLLVDIQSIVSVNEGTAHISKYFCLFSKYCSLSSFKVLLFVYDWKYCSLILWKYCSI